MLHNITLQSYSPADENTPSRFLIDGVLHSVEYRANGLQAHITRVQSMTDECVNDHGVFYKMARVQLAASQLKRLERILYACAAKLAFCQLFSKLRQEVNSDPFLFPRSISDRALRMSYRNLDTSLRNSIDIRRDYAYVYEYKKNLADVESLLGPEMVVETTIEQHTRRSIVEDIPAHVLERLATEPGLLERALKLRKFRHPDCVIFKIRELAQAITAHQAAQSSLIEIGVSK